MKECWSSRVNTRLESMRAKKTLAKLIEQYSATETDRQRKSELEPVNNEK